MVSSGHLEHSDAVGEAIDFYVVTESANVIWIGLNGIYSRATLSGDQGVDTDVGTHIQYHSSRFNQGTEQFTFFFFEKPGRMPEVDAYRFADAYVKPEVAVEIVDAK